MQAVQWVMVSNMEMVVKSPCTRSVLVHSREALLTLQAQTVVCFFQRCLSWCRCRQYGPPEVHPWTAVWKQRERERERTIYFKHTYYMYSKLKYGNLMLRELNLWSIIRHKNSTSYCTVKAVLAMLDLISEFVTYYTYNNFLQQSFGRSVSPWVPGIQ